MTIVIAGAGAVADEKQLEKVLSSLPCCEKGPVL